MSGGSSFKYTSLVQTTQLQNSTQHFGRNPRSPHSNLMPHECHIFHWVYWNDSKGNCCTIFLYLLSCDLKAHARLWTLTNKHLKTWPKKKHKNTISLGTLGTHKFFDNVFESLHGRSISYCLSKMIGWRRCLLAIGCWNDWSMCDIYMFTLIYIYIYIIQYLFFINRKKGKYLTLNLNVIISHTILPQVYIRDQTKPKSK
jgi:hypothetical protein